MTVLDQLFQSRATAYDGALKRYIDDTLTLNAEQSEACYTPIDAGLQVLAGAGTGKTMLIAARFLYLLDVLQERKTPNAESRILVMTFTKKAAGEMRERIHHHLQQAGYTGALPDENITTFNSFGQGFLTRHGVEAGLALGCEVMDEQAIATLKESINKRILKGNAQNLQGTLQRFNLWEKEFKREYAPTIDLFTPAVIQALSENAMPETLLEQLWAMVNKAKSCGLSPLDFHQLAHQQTDAYSQLIQTLPVLWQQMPVTGVDELYALWAHHLQHIATAAWTRESNRLGTYKENKDDYKALLDPNVFKEHPQLTIKRLPKIDAVHPADQSLWEGLRDTTAREHVMINLVTGLYALYQERLMLDNAMDYDDQINLTLQTLQKNERLRNRYRGWFEAIMVDEFQDSNGSQLALLKLLMRRPSYPSPLGERVPEGGERGAPQTSTHTPLSNSLPKGREDRNVNLTVVGDAKQSIYSFRFAQKENVELIFKGLTPTRISLVKNYRSRVGILHVANQIARETADDPTTVDPPLVSGFPLPSPPPKGEGVREEVVAYYIGRDEGGKRSELAGVRKEHAMQVLVGNLYNSSCHDSWKDTAILARSHADLKAIAALLDQLNIPNIQDRDQHLFHEPIVKDATALLRVLQNPAEEMALIRLLTPFLEPMRLLHAVEFARKVMKVERVASPSPALPLRESGQDEKAPPKFGFGRALLAGLADQALDAHRLKTLQKLITTLEDLHTHRAYDAPQSLLRGLLPLIETLSLGGRAQDPPLQKKGALPIRARLLFESICDLCQHHYEVLGKRYDLAALLKRLDKDAENPQFKLPLRDMHGTRQANAVQLMTFHSSKGLEFPNVHVFWFGGSIANKDGVTFDPQFSPKSGVGLVLHKDGDDKETLKYSLYKPLWQKPRDEGERKRLYYVALTRAKHRLNVYVDGNLLKAEPWLRLHENPESPEQGVVHDEAENETLFDDAYASYRELTPIESAETFSQGEPWLPHKQRVSASLKDHLEQIKRDNPTLPRISFSSLQVLEKCPTQYWFKYIHRWPDASRHQSQEAKAMSPMERGAKRGATLHRVIETHYRYCPISSDEQLQHRIEQVLEQSLGSLFDADKAIIRYEVLSIYQRFETSEFSITPLQEAGYTLLAPEQSLNFTLSPEQTGCTFTHRFYGQVDAILHHTPTNTYGLLDFKTNATLKDDAKAVYFEQMALYRLGMQLNNPHVEVARDRCELVHLPLKNPIARYPLPESFPLEASPWLRTAPRARSNGAAS